MSSAMPYRSGAVFTHPYPFVRAVYQHHDEDGLREIKNWSPGVRFVMSGPEDAEAVADGMGEQQLTIISSHKPGRFPERVFYTRRWIGPNGKDFGKTRLHIKTASAFRNLTNGYRYDFRMSDENDSAERIGA